MPITCVNKDPESLTMTVVADFAAPPRRLWDVYLDPRMLERFWGPRTYPAVFTRHDGCVGGRSEYAMTGPGGDVSRGYWEWIAVDEVLADLAAFAAGDGTTTQILSDTQVRISRIVGGGPNAVWRAHQEPTLLRQWLLGPDGWTMPVGEVATEVGQTYRYEWERLDGVGRFGFTGTLLESLPPHRSVTTEKMIGTDGPSTTNELTLTPVEGGTLLSMLITYPDATVRDTILATGMTDGMETPYARLESLIN